jgi:hypothetical protein
LLSLLALLLNISVDFDLYIPANALAAWIAGIDAAVSDPSPTRGVTRITAPSFSAGAAVSARSFIGGLGVVNCMMILGAIIFLFVPGI